MYSLSSWNESFPVRNLREVVCLLHRKSLSSLENDTYRLGI